jgi:hypothetical protein
MKIIKVRKGKIDHRIMVDDEDYDEMMKYKWTWRNGYAQTKIFGHYIGMHRLIMGAMRGDPDLIDHWDTNHKNNQKYNLRRANRFQNQQNRRTNKKNTLPKGIRLLPSGKYNVRIQAFGERQVIGTFDTLEEAVEERNRVATHKHGEFMNPSYILND